MAHWAGGSVSLVSVSHRWCTAPAWPCSSALLSGLFQMKTGPFAEHSNQLWNISAVPSWSKVNQGLIRMYKAEVSAGGGQGEAGSRFPSWPHRSLCLLRCGSALCCLHLVPVGAGPVTASYAPCCVAQKKVLPARRLLPAQCLPPNQSQNSASFRHGFCHFLSFHSTSLRSSS